MKSSRHWIRLNNRQNQLRCLEWRHLEMTTKGKGRGRSFFPSSGGNVAKQNGAPDGENVAKQNGAPDGGATPLETGGQQEGRSEIETVAETIERHLSMDQRISSQDIPLDRLRPNPFQAREEFTDEDIEELAESIRQH